MLSLKPRRSKALNVLVQSWRRSLTSIQCTARRCAWIPTCVSFGSNQFCIPRSFHTRASRRIWGSTEPSSAIALVSLTYWADSKPPWRMPCSSFGMKTYWAFFFVCGSITTTDLCPRLFFFGSPCSLFLLYLRSASVSLCVFLDNSLSLFNDT